MKKKIIENGIVIKDNKAEILKLYETNKESIDSGELVIAKVSMPALVIRYFDGIITIPSKDLEHWRNYALNPHLLDAREIDGNFDIEEDLIPGNIVVGKQEFAGKNLKNFEILSRPTLDD